MSDKKICVSCCGNCRSCSKSLLTPPELTVDSPSLEEGEFTLAKLPIGSEGTVVKVHPKWVGKKRFAEVGIIPGSKLQMEAHAPFGGLLRVKVMGSSLSFHRDAAANIILKDK